MSSTPTISVVLPVYNSDKYLAEAIASVLKQTFTDFELIIVNDGSTDSSLNIIKDFMSTDNRIVLISRENKGIVKSLNEAILSAKGKYIARMDADDICMPNRFAEQMQFIHENKLDLCGSFIQILNKQEKISIYPREHSDIVVESLFYSCFAHPSTIIKKNVFNKLRYQEEAAEDYNLWCDILLNGFKVGNCPKVLLQYRRHDQQLTALKTFEIESSAGRIARKLAYGMGDLEVKVLNSSLLFNETSQASDFKNFSDNLENLLSKHGGSRDCKIKLLSKFYSNSKSKSLALHFRYYYEMLRVRIAF